jgi:hypothetical protein
MRVLKKLFLLVHTFEITRREGFLERHEKTVERNKFNVNPVIAKRRKERCSAMDFICDPCGYHGWEVHLL